MLNLLLRTDFKLLQAKPSQAETSPVDAKAIGDCVVFTDRKSIHN